MQRTDTQLPATLREQIHGGLQRCPTGRGDPCQPFPSVLPPARSTTATPAGDPPPSCCRGEPFLPFETLRAFDAIARLGGVRKAAQYLCRDHAVVSRHLRAIEDWTGTKLIQRTPAGSVLTEDGLRYHRDIASALDPHRPCHGRLDQARQPVAIPRRLTIRARASRHKRRLSPTSARSRRRIFVDGMNLVGVLAGHVVEA